MSVPALAFALASAAYLGFQATIRLVVYPQFARVAAADFPSYERAHQARVTVLVAPLFAALALSAVAVAAVPPPGAPRALALAALVPPAVVVAVTGARAVPQHRRLSRGFDVCAHRRLLAADTVRLVAAATGAVLAVALLLV